MMRGEYLASLTPPQVRITGPSRDVGLLHDGLTVMSAASIVAEASGQPFVCTPAEAQQAVIEWHGGRRREEPEVRVVSPRTAELAYRGLVRAHGLLIESQAAMHGESSGLGVQSVRRYEMGRAIANLTGLHARLAEAGHFPETEPKK